MASKTAIANMALRRMGITQLIANVDTEPAKAAITIRDAWDAEVEYVLRSWPWPFATAYATLALVAGTESAPVNHDWTYAYRYPAGALMIRRIMTTDGRASTAPPPFTIGRDSQGRLIYSSWPEAQVEYTTPISDPEEFDPVFVSLLAWRLVMAVGVGLSRLEKIEQRALQGFLMEHPFAASVAGNESQVAPSADADWITGRN